MYNQNLNLFFNLISQIEVLIVLIYLRLMCCYPQFLRRKIKILMTNKKGKNAKTFSDLEISNYNYHLILVSMLKQINIFIIFNISREIFFMMINDIKLRLKTLSYIYQFKPIQRILYLDPRNIVVILIPSVRNS